MPGTRTCGKVISPERSQPPKRSVHCDRARASSGALKPRMAMPLEDELVGVQFDRRRRTGAVRRQLAGQCADQDEPCPGPGRGHRRLELFAADVVQEDVDAAWRDLGQLLVDRRRAADHGGVVPQLGHQPLRLLREPVLPITWPAPSSRAICPASEPTAPAPPETNTVSPAVPRRPGSMRRTPSSPGPGARQGRAACHPAGCTGRRPRPRTRATRASARPARRAQPAVRGR